jgi:hypothetical protein
MMMTEGVARKKWCPFARLDNNNRVFSVDAEGFTNCNPSYRCIASQCMGWREYHLSHLKGSITEAEMEKHGYCGYAGRPEHE